MAIVDNAKLATRVSTSSVPSAFTLSTAASQPQPSPFPVMLRLSPTCSTPIFLDSTTTYQSLLQQIQNEVYNRAPQFASGFEFDGLYVEWDQITPGFPCSTRVDEHNLAATISLLRARQGRDVLCLKARVTKAGVPMKLVV